MLPAAFQIPSFRLYFLGAAGAVNALWIQRVALGWIAWAATGSATFVGLVAALMLAPTFLSGPLFGVIVDRADVRRAALVTTSANLMLNAVLLGLWTLGVLSPVLLCVIATAVGFVAAAHHPVRMSLAPRLVARDQVSSVVALTALNFNIARSLSPAIAGALIEGAGVTAALVLVVVLYLPMLIVLPRLRIRATGHEGVRSPFFAALAEGLALAWRDPVIRTAMALVGLYALAGRSFLEILPVIADGTFARGAAGLGLLSSVAGLGALCAALVMSYAPNPPSGKIPRAAITLSLVGLVTLVVVGLAQSWPVMVAGACIAGFCGTYNGVTLQQVIQTDLADGARGRVMSLFMVVGLGGAATGAFALGALSAAIGAMPALLGAGAVGLVLITALLARAGRARA